MCDTYTAHRALHPLEHTGIVFRAESSRVRCVALLQPSSRGTRSMDFSSLQSDIVTIDQSVRRAGLPRRCARSGTWSPSG